MKMKKIFCVILSVVMISLLLMNNVYAVSDAISDNIFLGNISCKYENISANNIEIKVYSSELIYSEEGVNQYNHYLVDTVLTDSNGNFSFDKPKSPFLIKVSLDTLPYGTGVEHETVFYSNNEKSDVIPLAQVDNIKIHGDNSSYNIILLSSNGTPLFANYEVDETLSTNLANITYDNIDDLKINKDVNIRVGKINKAVTFTQDTTNLSILQKVDYLESLNLISQNEKINIYYEEWNRLSDIDKHIDESGIGQVLYEYASNNEIKQHSKFNSDIDINKKLISEISSLSNTANTSKPSYANGKNKIVGTFMLHYENGLAEIEEYTDILEDINTTFFSTYSFYKPYHEYLEDSTTVRDAYFHIYLVEKSYLNSDSSDNEEYDDDTVGRSVPIDPSDVTKGSYILMATLSDMTSFGKTLSHEIFHAVEYRYAGKKPTSWFSEAFANYGSILYLNGTCETLTSQVADYLNSTQYSLNNTSAYGNRRYGEVLLPLYIHNKMGGVNTIKKILTAYASTSSAYTAIDNGLQDASQDYSFAKAFYGHANYNAYTTYYKKPGTTTAMRFGVNAHRATNSSLGDSSNVSISSTTLPMNSSKYYQFNSTSTSNKTLTITITTNSNVNYSAYNIVKKKSGYSIPAQKTATSITTFTVTDFSVNSTKTVVLVAANTAKSSSYTNTFTASISTN